MHLPPLARSLEAHPAPRHDVPDYPAQRVRVQAQAHITNVLWHYCAVHKGEEASDDTRGGRQRCTA